MSRPSRGEPVTVTPGENSTSTSIFSPARQLEFTGGSDANVTPLTSGTARTVTVPAVRFPPRRCEP